MLYSQIKQYLDYGLMVVVVNANQNYRVFHRISFDHDLEATYFHHKTIEGALISGSELLDEEEISANEIANGWRIHSLLPRPSTPYPVGMKVRVDEAWIETAKDYENSQKNIERVQSKEIFVIKSFRKCFYGEFLYSLGEFNEGGFGLIDHRFLIPVLEEEKNQEKDWAFVAKESWLDAGRKNGWIKEGEVIE